MATLGARPVASGERDGLIVEEEPSESPRKPLLIPPVSEAQRADDPQVAGMKADDPAAVMQPAAIAGERTAERKRLDVSERRYSVLLAHHAVSTRSVAGMLYRGLYNDAMARFASTIAAWLALPLVCANIAACGSSSTPEAASSASRTSQTTAQSSGLSYARCMRSHGVNSFPDPSATGGFNLAAAGINQSSPTVRAAGTACRTLLPVKHIPVVQPTARAYTSLLHWVRCMRAHGISGMPDPKPDPPPDPNAAGFAPYYTVMGNGGYWVGIPKDVNGHSSAFIRLATRCGESPTGRHR